MGAREQQGFDALAAGCLVVTNNHVGAAELFENLLPTYRDRDSLTEVINWWLAHERERQERYVCCRESCRNGTNMPIASSAGRRGVVVMRTTTADSLKCPARKGKQGGLGRYHFCQSLARALRELGLLFGRRA